MPGITDAVAVSSGPLGSCALLASGEVACWGLSDDGRLGDGNEDLEYCHPNGLNCSRTPVLVANLTDAVGVSVSSTSACAIRSSGDIVCWGTDVHPVDDETWTYETHWTPVEIDGVSDAIDVSTGSQPCAVTADGTVTCWTAFDDDPPSGGTMPGTPQVVPGLTGVVDIDQGSAEHWCAVHDTGQLSCWGQNNTGQVGNGETSANLPDPVAVVGIDDAVAASAGNGHSCAVRASGRLACWGANRFGQLGDGTIVGQFSPVDVVWP